MKYTVNRRRERCEPRPDKVRERNHTHSGLAVDDAEVYAEERCRLQTEEYTRRRYDIKRNFIFWQTP